MGLCRVNKPFEEGFRSPQRWNFRLMLIRSFRYGVLAQDRDGVLDCFQLFQLWKSEQSSYSAMLNISEPVPSIPEIGQI
ncbi:unnamed protein product [Rotaria socialis]|uniref:Uncharacterized protein n=1 Tax=Rotaria socialis TaxID=392032 RepID=A0A821SWH0_9BILA|nr:unnamed protein product [Rotaria socialis]CAF4863116.1 unnamed protein product [Rotaria socialis]